MDQISKTRLAQVHPLLASKIRDLSDQLASEGIRIRVTQGLRSWNDQAKLYAQGRTVPGKIVTEAKPGFSQHCFGLAVDVVPMDINNIPDWNISHPNWKRIVEIGKSLGLEAGAEFRTFPDWPHFQLTGKWPITPDDEQRQVFLDGGMQSVWADAQLPQLPDSVHSEETTA